MAPIEYEPSWSKTGVQVVPLLTVFQTPPDAAADEVFRRDYSDRPRFQ